MRQETRLASPLSAQGLWGRRSLFSLFINYLKTGRSWWGRGPGYGRRGRGRGARKCLGSPGLKEGCLWCVGGWCEMGRIRGKLVFYTHERMSRVGRGYKS